MPLAYAGDNLGCFGGSRTKKKEDAVDGTPASRPPNPTLAGHRQEPPRGMQLLWQSEVVRCVQ